MLKRVFVFLLCLCLFVTAAACQEGKLSEEELELGFDKAGAPPRANRQQLKIPIPAGLDRDFRPGWNLGLANQAISRELYLGLVEQKSDKQEKLMLAEEIEHSEDCRTWTVTINNAFRWSDGSTVTAADVYESILRKLAPNSQCPTVFKAYMIEGAKAYHEGRGEDIGITLEGNTLVFVLNQPYEGFQLWLAQDFFKPEKTNDNGEPLFSGPYRLVPDTKDLKLKKNPSYFAAETVLVEDVEFIEFSDDVKAYEAFKLGEIDLIGLPFLDIPHARRQTAARQAEYINFAVNAISFIDLNATNTRLRDSSFRDLLYQALDVPFITAVVRSDHSEPLFAQEAPKLAERRELTAEFEDFEEQFTGPEIKRYIALSDDNYLHYRELVATAKQWLDLYKLPTLVKQESKIELKELQADFYYVEILIGAGELRDIYWYLLANAEPYGFPSLAYEISEKKAYFSDFADLRKDLRILPLAKLAWPAMVQPSLAGYRVYPDGMPRLEDCQLR